MYLKEYVLQWNTERSVKKHTYKDWWSDSSDRPPAWQVPGPEFKPQYQQKKIIYAVYIFDLYIYF
jgi:hypothetical protein